MKKKKSFVSAWVEPRLSRIHTTLKLIQPHKMCSGKSVVLGTENQDYHLPRVVRLGRWESGMSECDSGSQPLLGWQNQAVPENSSGDKTSGPLVEKAYPFSRQVKGCICLFFVNDMPFCIGAWINTMPPSCSNYMFFVVPKMETDSAVEIFCHLLIPH